MTYHGVIFTKSEMSVFGLELVEFRVEHRDGRYGNYQITNKGDGIALNEYSNKEFKYVFNRKITAMDIPELLPKDWMYEWTAAEFLAMARGFALASQMYEFRAGCAA